MLTPLVIGHVDGRYYIVHNKKIINIPMNTFKVPVFVTNVTTQICNVIGYGQIPLGIEYVDQPGKYNKIKGNCPVNFTHQLVTTNKAFINQYPNSNELDICYFDIEVLTKGDNLFPKSDERPIICIGAAINDEEVVIFKDYDFKNEKKGDKKILEDFLNWIDERDPDLLCGYNSYDFDIPYIIDRCKKLGLPWHKLYRFHKLIYDNITKLKYMQIIESYAKLDKTHGMATTDFLGRINYDVYAVDVKRDQMLNDLKDRKMKTLAKHCGFEDVVELGDDVGNTQKLLLEDPERLWRYQESDVRQTRSIAKRYLSIDIALAEELSVPLEVMIARSNGTPATLYLLREMYKNHIYVIDTNAQRYKDLYLLNPKYQGAINGVYKTGFFEELHKFDFANMYPSSMWTWNLGPDTVRLLKLSEYTGEYKFKLDNGILYMELPDANYNRQITMAVDQSKPSIIKTAIEKLWADRAKFKKIMKQTDEGSKEWTDANTAQSSIKIILNSLYGINGNTHSIGDMAVAIAVTALCRYTSQFVLDYLGDNCVAIDTDGIMTDKFFQEQDINDKINEYLTNTTFIKESKMRLEHEWGVPTVRGYIYRMKNYVLDKSGDIVKHGVSMKASSLPKIYDKTVDMIIDYMFKNKYTKQELLQKVYDVENLPIEDYVGVRSLNKEPDLKNSYGDDDDDTFIIANVANLIKQLQDVKNIKATIGTRLEYIYIIDSKNGQPTVCIPELLEDRKYINYQKYKEIVDKILKIFKLNLEIETVNFHDIKSIEEDDGSFLL